MVCVGHSDSNASAGCEFRLTKPVKEDAGDEHRTDNEYQWKQAAEFILG